LKEAISSDPRLPHPHVQLAIIQLFVSGSEPADGGKSLQEALDHIERALQVAPDFPQAHRLAAIIRASLANRCLKTSPEQAQSYFIAAVASTKAAVEGGIPAEALLTVMTLLQPLDANNEIDSLLSSASGSGRIESTTLLADPLDSRSLPF
jgi:hypothetical protein